VILTFDLGICSPIKAKNPIASVEFAGL